MAVVATNKSSSVIPNIAINKVENKPVSTTDVSNKTSLSTQLLLAGTAACIADLFTFPLDTCKVRLQVIGEGGASGLARTSVSGTLKQIVRTEGVAALYSGIVPGLQRQMAFSAIRIGAYEHVREYYKELTGVTGGLGLMAIRIGAGVTTGTLAILAAQPTDVVKGVLDAYLTIKRQEGMIGGLYRGTLPNIGRNCIINVGETVIYDAVKDGLISSQYMVDGIPCHFVSAFLAGVTATFVASPVDVIKTRFMNSPKGKYSGVLNCARQTAQREGVKAFYSGFRASCMRLVSWNIVLWLSYEQLKLASQNYNNKS